MDTQTSLFIVSTLLGILCLRALQKYLWASTVSAIHGPESKSWAFGNLVELLLPPTYGFHEFAWTKQFGAVYRIRGCFGQDRLVISDPTALQYITNSGDFQQGPLLAVTRTWLYEPKGVVFLQGEEHARLRAALNVGFSASAVRRCRPIFDGIALWISDQLDRTLLAHTEGEEINVNLSPVLAGAALRAITDAAFGCPVTLMAPELLQLNNRLLEIVSTGTKTQLLFDAFAIRLPKPLLRLAIHLPTAAFRALRAFKFVSRSEGWRLVHEKTKMAMTGVVEEREERDVYSTLLQTPEKNSKDDASPSKKMLSAQDLVAQTSLFLIAGQDTTANTLAFGFLELARRPALQSRLRAEIQAATARSTVAYESLPLLNAFIKETMRMYPASPLPERVAVRDCVIPLSTEGGRTVSSEKMQGIPVSRGQVVMVAIAAYQRFDPRWGANGEEFDPDRWLDGRVRQGDALGPYANLLSFFAGPHTCLGWRFAILEMQTVLFKLIGDFEFSVPETEGRAFRMRLATTLLPLDKDGKKGTRVCVKRVV
ncbi:cytochrome P450 [Roridomyces roridus]|uniref:Cytochrome P450 n=1 Tax=Roridomyces roridus TaxID=1738132 RepID=A0AAD7BD94_9AGAR|nr:cytochrome P450 [Roridomyces roridus]